MLGYKSWHGGGQGCQEEILLFPVQLPVSVKQTDFEVSAAHPHLPPLLLQSGATSHLRGGESNGGNPKI